MSKRKHHGWLRGLLGYVLALLLTVSIVAACALTLLDTLLTDQALHERVALDSRVVDAQMARIEETVNELAEAYAFAPETALSLVTRERVEAYGREMVAWWMGLLGGHPDAEAPFLDIQEMEDAIREDERFRENTNEFMRRTIARDSVAYPIVKAAQEAVIPVRVSLIALAMPEVAERVDIPMLVGLLGKAKIALYAASAILLALVLLTQGRNRFLFGSVALTAAGLLLAGATAAVALLHPVEAMATLSAPLALQLSVLGEALLPAVALTEGAVLLLGLILLALCAVGRRKASARLEGIGA